LCDGECNLFWKLYCVCHFSVCVISTIHILWLRKSIIQVLNHVRSQWVISSQDYIRIYSHIGRWIVCFLWQNCWSLQSWSMVLPCLSLWGFFEYCRRIILLCLSPPYCVQRYIQVWPYIFFIKLFILFCYF
jgi:hypothetical protein